MEPKIQEIKTVGDVWAVYDAVRLTRPSISQVNMFEDARILKKLLDLITELEDLIKEIYPQFYGMLCKRWGDPYRWPSYDAAGAITYEKILKVVEPSDKEDGEK